MRLIRQKNGWMSVPQFGGWDQKMSRTDYSMVFQRARANRKQNKIQIKAASLGNEQELIAHAREELPSVRTFSISSTSIGPLFRFSYVLGKIHPQILA